MFNKISLDSSCARALGEYSRPMTDMNRSGEGPRRRRPIVVAVIGTVVVVAYALLAAVQSTRDERSYESAMLRTLGASRRVVLAGVATEFVVLGVLSGLLAAIGASVGGCAPCNCSMRDLLPLK
mgnify:CR=1 FL=1